MDLTTALTVSQDETAAVASRIDALKTLIANQEKVQEAWGFGTSSTIPKMKFQLSTLQKQYDDYAEAVRVALLDTHAFDFLDERSDDYKNWKKGLL